MRSDVRKIVLMGMGEPSHNLDAVCEAVDVPVIASGGAGCAQDFVELFRAVPRVSAGLAASIFHFGEVEIGVLKRTLDENGINVRL